MPRELRSKYVRPASGIGEDEMTLLFRAREDSPTRAPITRLLAAAVRQAYGHLADAPIEMPQPQTERIAASTNTPARQTVGHIEGQD